MRTLRAKHGFGSLFKIVKGDCENSPLAAAEAADTSSFETKIGRFDQMETAAHVL